MNREVLTNDEVLTNALKGKQIMRNTFENEHK